MRKEPRCSRHARHTLWSNTWDIGRNDRPVKERTMWKSLPGWISKGAIIIEELGAGERAFGAAFVVTAEEKTGALGVKVRGGADIAPFVTAVAWGGEKIPVSFYYSRG